LAGKTALVILANTPMADSPAKWCMEAFAQWLVRNGANPDEPPGVALKYALGCANVFMVGHLLSARANVAEAERRFVEAASQNPKRNGWGLWDFILLASSRDSTSSKKFADMLEQHGRPPPADFDQRRDALPTRADHLRPRSVPARAFAGTPAAGQAKAACQTMAWPQPPMPGHRLLQAAAPQTMAWLQPAADAVTTPPPLDQAVAATPPAAGQPAAVAVTTPPPLVQAVAATPPAAGHMGTPAAPSNLSTAAAGQRWQTATWMPDWRGGLGAWRVAPPDAENDTWVYCQDMNVYAFVARP